jgi:hypothetical protein
MLAPELFLTPIGDEYPAYPVLCAPENEERLHPWKSQHLSNGTAYLYLLYYAINGAFDYTRNPNRPKEKHVQYSYRDMLQEASVNIEVPETVSGKSAVAQAIKAQAREAQNIEAGSGGDPGRTRGGSGHSLRGNYAKRQIVHHGNNLLKTCFYKLHAHSITHLLKIHPLKFKPMKKVKSIILLSIVSIKLAMAQVAIGIDAASSELITYVDPVANMILIVGAIVGLIGGVRVYLKWNSGDQDVQKSIMDGLVPASS